MTEHNWPFNKPTTVAEELLDILDYIKDRNLTSDALRKLVSDRLYEIGHIPIEDIEKFLE